MTLTVAQIDEAILMARLTKFLDTRTAAERDLFRIALAYHSSRCIAVDKRRGKKLNPQETKELKQFEGLQRKYKFNYLKPVSEKEREQFKKQALEHGIFLS